MDREIKFRAFRKKDKKMGMVISIGFTKGRFTSVSAGMKTEVRRSYWTLADISELGDKVVLMQYTGLKDKNGTEIYEGDVVESEYIWGEVKFLSGGFCILGSHPSALPIFGIVSEGIEVEVAGNIYENPELLDE